MPFIGKLLLEPLPPKIVKRRFLGIIPYKKTVFEWELHKRFGYIDRELDIKVIVPEGSKTDFASVPRVFWNILPPWGRYGWAAVIHDYLYRHGMYNRMIADLVFLHAMRELDVPEWKQTVMFEAVRLFGKSAYQGILK